MLCLVCLVYVRLTTGDAAQIRGRPADQGRAGGCASRGWAARRRASTPTGRRRGPPLPCRRCIPYVQRYLLHTAPERFDACRGDVLQALKQFRWGGARGTGGRAGRQAGQPSLAAVQALLPHTCCTLITLHSTPAAHPGWRWWTSSWQSPRCGPPRHAVQWSPGPQAAGGLPGGACIGSRQRCRCTRRLLSLVCRQAWELARVPACPRARPSPCVSHPAMHIRPGCAGAAARCQRCGAGGPQPVCRDFGGGQLHRWAAASIGVHLLAQKASPLCVLPERSLLSPPPPTDVFLELSRLFGGGAPDADLADFLAALTLTMVRRGAIQRRQGQICMGRAGAAAGHGAAGRLPKGGSAAG